MDESGGGSSAPRAGEPVRNGVPDNPKDLRLVDYPPEPQLVTDITDVPRAKCTAIDCHDHLEELVDRGSDAIDNFVREMGENNVQAVVNLDGRWGKALDRATESPEGAVSRSVIRLCPSRFQPHRRAGFWRASCEATGADMKRERRGSRPRKTSARGCNSKTAATSRSIP